MRRPGRCLPPSPIWQTAKPPGADGSPPVRPATTCCAWPLEVLQGLPIRYLADWSDRIAAGELPAHRPLPGLQGLERNVVATVRDWSEPAHYMHDLSGTDRRNPTVNGYGPLYGAPELSTDDMPILDPVRNTATSFQLPVRDADTPSTSVGSCHRTFSPTGVDEAIWDSRANVHNPMLDQDGRVWFTARIRGPDNPDFCRPGSDHPSARHFPTGAQRPTTRRATIRRRANTASSTPASARTICSSPKTKTTRLWTSGGRNVVGWLNTRRFLETGDAAAAAGLGAAWYSTPTATAGAMPGPSPASLRTRRVTCAWTKASTP